MAEINALAEFYKFELFEDPELMKMIAAGAAFLDDVHAVKPPRWLTFLGCCGTGKTHLAGKLFETTDAILDRQAGDFKRINGLICDWPTIVDRLRSGEYHIVNHLIAADVLLLDEIGAELSTPFVLEKLFRIFNGRLGKWTILTGNLTPRAIADQDARLISRLERGGNVVVTVDTTDFSKRIGESATIRETGTGR